MSELESAKYWLSWIEFGGTIAVALVAIGVTMEFAETWLAKPLRHKIELAHEEELASLARSAAEANEAAEKLRASNLELERLVQPRNILPGSWDASVAALRAVGSASVSISTSSIDGESMRLALNLVRLMKAADWKVPTAPPGPQMGGVVFGVYLGAGNPSPKAKTAADALLATLKGNGIAAALAPAEALLQNLPMSGEVIIGADVQIVVGLKPIPE